VIGSELRGLTQVRDSASTYPFVAALVDLAADVKACSAPTPRSPTPPTGRNTSATSRPDGSGDVYFHLDPLWSSPAIDAIGIDVYWPLADWRDGTDHLDRQAGASSIYDLAYLASNIAGGEGYDGTTPGQADRDAQLRSAITDGGAGKPWTFRYKDILGWWSNPHFDRPAASNPPRPPPGCRSPSPFWFTELGCPAVDKGANQPNVFIDPKSSESNLPYYSAGTRDDFMQRRYLQAFHTAFDPDDARYIAGSNPESTVYDGRMVDLDHLHVYTWDARPYPAFPPTPTPGATARTGASATGSPAAWPARRSMPPSPPCSPTTASPPTTPAR
jgi:hypothetical protein